MSLITTESLAKILDELATVMHAARGTSGSGLGLGEPTDTYGAADAIDDIQTLILETADSDVIARLLKPAQTVDAGLSAKRLVGITAKPLLTALSAHFYAQGNANYSDFKTYLDYLNTTSPGAFACPADYRLRDLYNGYRGGSNHLDVTSLYMEVLEGSVIGGTTYSNGLGKRVIATSTNTLVTSPISTSQVAGGVPSITITGIAGTGSVTVTGTAVDPATGIVSTGVTFVFAVASAVNGRYYRTGGTAAANAYIAAVSDITHSGLTAGTVIVEAQRPVLRTGTCGADVVTNTTVGLDDSASAINDFYNGLYIGTNADAYAPRLITDYDGATKVVTVSSAWGTNPTASTSTFRLWRQQVA